MIFASNEGDAFDEICFVYKIAEIFGAQDDFQCGGLPGHVDCADALAQNFVILVDFFLLCADLRFFFYNFFIIGRNGGI